MVFTGERTITRALVILTWNEIDGTTALVDQFPVNEVTEVIAVDGGSTDGTVEVFEKAGIKVVGQEKRGRGEAFRVAIANTTSENIVFYSPDGNEDPADIVKVFEELEKGEADMVIASRFHTDGSNEEDDETFAYRKWANQAFTFAANFCWNISSEISCTYLPMIWYRSKL